MEKSDDRRTDPLADYVDADGVRHAWDYAGDHSWNATPDWFHPDPRRPLCRDRSCPGNLLVQRNSLRVVNLAAGTAYRPDEEDGLLVYRLRVDDGVDPLELHRWIVNAVHDFDWETRFGSVTATSTAIGTVRPDQLTELTEPTEPEAP